MKEAFFTFLAISIPVLAIGGVVYMFLHGLYRLFDDWRLGRELRELREESARHPRAPSVASTPVLDPMAAFDDRPLPPEPEGIITFPLDSDWEVEPPHVSANDASPDQFQSVEQPKVEPEIQAEVDIEPEPKIRESQLGAPSETLRDHGADDWPHRTLD